jgi:undecaprenyl-diphosphatase
MNAFDTSIIHFLNQFAQRSWFADRLIVAVAYNHLLTSALITSIFWWAWFRDDEVEGTERPIVVSTILLTTGALFLARVLALLLPFRERPLRNPSLQFHIPFGVSQQALINWSAFPSDHAVFFFALTTCMLFLSRKLAIATFCYVLVVICVPMVYMGVHYPTDILAGALIGIGVACLLLSQRLRSSLSSMPLLWLKRSPAVFYPCFYLITFLFGTMFDPLRAIVTAAWHTGRSIVHH